jgi:thiosulfate reductase cytochrome b subunit
MASHITLFSSINFILKVHYFHAFALVDTLNFMCIKGSKGVIKEARQPSLRRAKRAVRGHQKTPPSPPH